MNRKTLLIAFFFIGALSMLIMSVQYFLEEYAGILGRKELKDSLWYRISLLTHISFGLSAIFLGPFQLVEKFRIKKPALHKGIGYIYCLSVGIASVSGLLIAQFAMGGIITRIGFSCLSILWFVSLFQAMSKILAGNILEHQKWMHINYALTFAAITQRTLLLFALIPGFSFMPIYQLSSVLPWMFNLAVVLIID